MPRQIQNKEITLWNQAKNYLPVLRRKNSQVLAAKRLYNVADSIKNGSSSDLFGVRCANLENALITLETCISLAEKQQNFFYGPRTDNDFDIVAPNNKNTYEGLGAWPLVALAVGVVVVISGVIAYCKRLELEQDKLKAELKQKTLDLEKEFSSSTPAQRQAWTKAKEMFSDDASIDSGHWYDNLFKAIPIIAALGFGAWLVSDILKNRSKNAG